MTPPSPPTRLHNGAEKAATLALSLAQAEKAILEFSESQVDAIVDAEGRAYLLRPAQESLRQNERRLQAIIDGAADVITVVSRGGIILSQSRAVTRLLGYEPEGLVGSNIFELIYEEDLDRLWTAFFNVIEGFQESAMVQFYHPIRGGTYRLIEATVGKLGDASTLGVVLIFRPIAQPSASRMEGAGPLRPDLPSADADHNCVILSHGRRIPFLGTPLGTPTPIQPL